MIKNIIAIAFLGIICCIPAGSMGAVLFQENFDDNNFTSRGWYDGATGAVDKNEHITGSSASLICHFLLAGTKCNPADGQYTLRHKFTPTNSVYLSYWIKHSSNWVGSGKPYHPHILLFLTNLNGDYSGLAYTYLTVYVEEAQGYPVFSIQDGQNIDETKIGSDLTTITENRSVAGCNGTPPNMGHYSVDCYLNGSVHWNGTVWRSTNAFFFDPNQKSNWHFIEAYFQLNSIVNGIGQQDGIIRYWYDGQLLINHNNIIMKTGKNPSMLFNQFIIAPYIGDGSPVDQTFWIDNLTIADSKPTSTAPPSPPTNVRVQ